MKTYICNSCGASLALNDEISFTTCLYCGNNIAFCDKSINDLNIKKIIPFEIDRDEAINNFVKIFNENVVDAKKVYVPIRYCNYDFDFLMYYEYIVYESDDKTKYADTEELLDGRVENDYIFGNGKIDYVYCQNELRDKERLNFDPVLLKDVSIEYSNFTSNDDIIRNINSDIYHFSYNKIKTRRRVSKVYSVNYTTSNIEVEDFSTLIPVYVIKSDEGVIYNIPGIKLVKTFKKDKRKKITFAIVGALLVIGAIFLYSVFSDSKNGGSSTLMWFFSLFIVLPIVVIFLHLYYQSVVNSKKSYDNFEYNKYSFNDKRKSIK